MKLRIIIFAIYCLTGFNLAAQQHYVCDAGTVLFVSEAALETIKASSDRLQGIVDPTSNRFAFRVTISSFTGFNSPLQLEHFNENYLESSTIETALFEGRLVDELDYGKPGEYEIRAKGTMSIHGVKKEKIIPCKVKIDPETLTVNAHFYVLLVDYNITIPKVVSRKISEEIAVDVSVIMELK